VIRLSAGGALIGDVPPAPLKVVYDALRLQDLRTTTGSSTYPQGTPVGVEVDLVNRSSGPVTLPYAAYGDESSYAAGILQMWIERLGPDPDMDCLPDAGRKGGWYADGGSIITAGMPVTIPPGGMMPMLAVGGPSADLTGCLPPGAYRYHVEYLPFNGGEDDVIDDASIDFMITPGQGSTPALTPSPSPRPVPSPGPSPTPWVNHSPLPSPSLDSPAP